MSITDELREYAAGWRDRSCYKHLLAIADRIDAEHAEAVADAELGASPTEEQMAELGWVKLPVDADGIPVKLGDTVRMGSTVIEVIGIGNVTSDMNDYGVFCQREDGRYEWFNARFLHHVKPDSWERIIHDAFVESQEHFGSADDVAELVERCRRLAGEAE